MFQLLWCLLSKAELLRKVRMTLYFCWLETTLLPFCLGISCDVTFISINSEWLITSCDVTFISINSEWIITALWSCLFVEDIRAAARRARATVASLHRRLHRQSYWYIRVQRASRSFSRRWLRRYDTTIVRNHQTLTVMLPLYTYI